MTIWNASFYGAFYESFLVGDFIRPKHQVRSSPSTFFQVISSRDPSRFQFLPNLLGCPRTIQDFETVIKNKGWQKVQWDGSMVETVVDSTMAMANRCLEDAEIMLLLRPRTSISDIKKNEDLISALSGTGESICHHRFKNFSSPPCCCGAHCLN